MTIKTVKELPAPFQKMLGIPRYKTWTVALSPTELATLQAARDICERVNDSGKQQYGQDEFYEVDDNWSRAENSLAELLEFGDEPQGVYRYPID